MRRVIIFLFIVSVYPLFSCKKKMTCAAYQSYFLLDDEAQARFFSPFGEDSLPRTSQIALRKGKGTGITAGITPKTYKKNHYFVPMKDVITQVDTVGSIITAIPEETPPIESDPDGISTSPLPYSEGG